MVDLSGFLVIAPDYFRGKTFKGESDDLESFIHDHSEWNKIRRDFYGLILPFARKKGAVGQIGTVGNTIEVIIN